MKTASRLAFLLYFGLLVAAGVMLWPRAWPQDPLAPSPPVEVQVQTQRVPRDAFEEVPPAIILQPVADPDQQCEPEIAIDVSATVIAAEAPTAPQGFVVTRCSDGRWWWHDGVLARWTATEPKEGMRFSGSGGSFVFSDGLMLPEDASDTLAAKICAHCTAPTREPTYAGMLGKTIPVRQLMAGSTGRRIPIADGVALYIPTRCTWQTSQQADGSLKVTFAGELPVVYATWGLLTVPPAITELVLRISADAIEVEACPQLLPSFTVRITLE